MKKVALFDLDGVVFDTEGQYTRFWGGVCKHYFPDKPGLEQRIKGSTLVQIYDRYFSDMKDEQPRITAQLNEFEQHMQYVYIPGFEDFIKLLRSNGVKTAVVTSSNQAKMENVYHAHPEFKGYFDAILTSEDFARSKPDPDCYLKGAARFNALPSECVGFEDSVNGLKAVRAAGMLCVGLTTTNPLEVVGALADITVADFTQLRLSQLG